MLNSLYDPLIASTFALLASLLWGLGGFFAGQASRRGPLIPILTLDIFFGLLLITPIALLNAQNFTLRDFLIGGFAGIFGIVGGGFLYLGLKNSLMVSVIPVSGVIGALLPVIWGLAVGENLSLTQSIGILVGLISILLVSGFSLQIFNQPISGLKNALFSGFGFGGFFIVIEYTDSSTEPWAAVSGRLFPIIILLLLMGSTRNFSLPKKSLLPLVLGAGLTNAGAGLCFLYAVNRGLLSVSSMLSSLFPAVTVILARAFLNEKLSRNQVLGVIGAVLSMSLVAYG